MRARSVLALLALLLAPATAAAQGNCRIARIDPEGYARRLAGPGGSEILFVSGPVEVHCGVDVVVRADSAHSTGPELRLVGNVFYQDSVQTLTSDIANYFRQIGRVTARGSVVVRDRHGPSVIRGTELQYDRVTPTRPEANIIMRGRPRAYLYEEGTAPLPSGMEPSPGLRIVGGDTIPAALQVDADRLEVRGEGRMIASGRVQMIRENIRAFGDQADFDRNAGRLELTGTARVEGEGYELFGDLIVASMLERQLEHVRAERNAQLMGEEIDVRAPVIDIALEAGDVERMIAVSHQDGIQANAVAEDFQLIADSIQVDAPRGVLDRLTAIGDAFGERAADSASATHPDIVRRDWLRGDTIVGTFIQLAADSAAAAAGDTVETALNTLTATGNARSIYRMEAASDRADRPAVNYITATLIALRFENGEVVSVETIGPVAGVHLEPDPVRPASNDADGDTDDGAGSTSSREQGGAR